MITSGSSGAAGRNRGALAATEDGVRRLRIRQEDAEEEEFTKGVDYVPLSSSGDAASKKRKRDEEVMLGLAVGAGVEEGEDDVVEEEESDAEDYVNGNVWGDRKTMVELAKRVETEPTNVFAWLEYVDHHDKMIHGGGRRKTAAEKKSTDEIKLDILGKAIEKCPDSQKLLLKYMDIAQELWEPKKVLKKWKEVLVTHPTLIRLWIRYINFRQTDFLSFTYQECLACYTECIAVLRDAIFRDTNPENILQLEEILLYMFLRVVLFMKEAGYIEISIAALQAMMEVSMFLPETIKPPRSTKSHTKMLEEFEMFWDSEILRFGEAGAQGWDEFLRHGCNGPAPNPVTEINEPLPVDPGDPYGSWIEAEKTWSKKLGMPARTIDEIEEDDPFRVAMFSDLKELLYYFTTQQVKDKLLDAFAFYFGLPPVHTHSSHSVEMDDAFLRNGILESLDSWFWKRKDDVDGVKQIVWEGMEPEKKSGFGDNPFEFKLCNGPVAEEAVFTNGKKWFNGIERMKLSNPVSITFVSAGLRMLVANLPNEGLALYCLAFELANNPTSIKQTAKAVLKIHKTSLRLYSAYAQIECTTNCLSAARNIFMLAIGMNKGTTEAATRARISIWHAWIWEELTAGNDSEAYRLLLSIERGRPLTEEEFHAAQKDNIIYLKSHRHLEHRAQQTLAQNLPFLASIYMDLLALLLYLATAPRSLTKPLALHLSHINLQTTHHHPSAAAVELSHTRLTRLLHHHATHSRPFRPATLRAHLETALTHYPHNTHLLSLYAWNEARTKIDNRIRGVLLQRDEGTVEWWLFAVWIEMRLSVQYNRNAVRGLWERATNQHRGSVVLWMAWVRWEVSVGEVERARTVWRRAWRWCPWNREVVMVGVELGLDGEEVGRVLGITAEEKGLRVHDFTECQEAAEGLEGRGGVVIMRL